MHSGRRKICVIVAALDEALATEGDHALSRIARLLAGRDNVTLLWVPTWEGRPGTHTAARWHAMFAEAGVELVVLQSSDQLLPGLSTPESRSAAVLHHLQRSSYDLVYAPLEGGLLYFMLMAAETGVFDAPMNVLVAHAPQEWANHADRVFIPTLDGIAVRHMEKYCAEMSDGLVCSSDLLRNWMLSRNWSVERAIVARLPLPHDSLPPADTRPSIGSAAGKELVLLAGPKFRDGLTLFCDALDVMATSLPQETVVTAFGPFASIMGEHTGGLLLRRAEKWPIRLNLYSSADLGDRLRYAARNGAIAVVPSLSTTTGSLVAAVLAAGLSFVATSAGANQEIGILAGCEDQLADPDARSLAAAMREALADPRPARRQSMFDFDRDFWIAARDSTAPSPGRGGTRKQSPAVSIVMVHRNRIHYLAEAIQSVERQTYENFELLLVDDGSDRAEVHAYLDQLEPGFSAKGWRIIRRKHEHLGSARNAGVKAARGEFILFVDDDNALFPEAVEEFVTAIMASGADICTAFHLVFYEDTVPQDRSDGLIQYLPLGGPDSLGLVHNVYGDANAIIRKTVFGKIGFLVDDPGYAMHDWEFFARASLAGLKLRPIPKPLYWYRSKPDSMFRRSNWQENRLPILETFKSSNFDELRPLLELAIAQNTRRAEVESARENLNYVASHRKYLSLCEVDANSASAIERLASIAASNGRGDTAATLVGQQAASELAGQVRSAVANPSGGREVHMLAHDTLSRARLLTPRASDLPLLMIAPGNGGIFLRPHTEGPVAAAIDNAFPPFFRTLEAVVEVAHESAPAIDFAIGLARSDQVIDWQRDINAQTLAFSGWHTITEKFVPRPIQISIRARRKFTLSIIVAVRMSGLRNRLPSNSFFRSIRVYG